MKQIIKKILVFCLPMALLTFASCNKDSDDSAPASLVGTTWQADSDPQGSLVFSTATEGAMVYHGERMSFTYTYSNGSGTMTMQGETGAFTVNGNKMTVTAPNGKSETFTKVGGGNGGGGQQNDNALVGTTWRYQETQEGVTLTIRFIFTTQSNVTVQMSYMGEGQSFNTTYVYSNGRGTIYAPPGEEGDVVFTVQGNTMYATMNGETLTLHKE